MSEDPKQVVSNLISKLKQESDELRLQMHLGKEDLKDEWDKLQVRLRQMSEKYEPLQEAVGETAEEVWESLKLVGGEILAGFDRIRKSL